MVPLLLLLRIILSLGVSIHIFFSAWPRAWRPTNQELLTGRPCLRERLDCKGSRASIGQVWIFRVCSLSTDIDRRKSNAKELSPSMNAQNVSFCFQNCDKGNGISKNGQLTYLPTNVHTHFCMHDNMAKRAPLGPAADYRPGAEWSGGGDGVFVENGRGTCVWTLHNVQRTQNVHSKHTCVPSSNATQRASRVPPAPGVLW